MASGPRGAGGRIFCAGFPLSSGQTLSGIVLGQPLRGNHLLRPPAPWISNPITYGVRSTVQLSMLGAWLASPGPRLPSAEVLQRRSSWELGLGRSSEPLAVGSHLVGLCVQHRFLAYCYWLSAKHASR